MTDAVFHSMTVAIDSSLTEGGSASIEDVQQFDAMMADENSVMDRAVELLENVKTSINESDQKIVSSMAVKQDEPMSMQAIMAVQAEMAKKHLQEELMTKIASKTTQHVDTFLKAQ